MFHMQTNLGPVLGWVLLCFCFQAKILDHDNVNNLKKILGELAMVLDQVEAELEKGKLEYQGLCLFWGGGGGR